MFDSKTERFATLSDVYFVVGVYRPNKTSSRSEVHTIWKFV